ncbi:MAG: hypothetical protein JSR34_12270 [Proteobacteria bacterium]|nr:hypothetical protein [Pseudomonadota bacterium]
MSLRARREAVRAAQAECARRRAAIDVAWDHLKDETTAAASPERIVIAGVLAGFLAGFPGGGQSGGSLLGGKLIEAVVDGAFAHLGAAFSAGAAAAHDEPSATTSAAPRTTATAADAAGKSST